MIYIPGSGSSQKKEPVKSSHRKDEKRQENSKEKGKSGTTPRESNAKAPKKTKKSKREPIQKKAPPGHTHSKGSRGFSFILILLVLIAVFFSVAAFLKMQETEKQLSSRLDEISGKYNTWYQEIKNKTEENYRLLQPNSWLNKAVIASNMIEEYIIGVDEIIAIAQERNFSKVAFFKVFISGNSPVWFNVKSDEKNYFAENISPGLGSQEFYYYKKPEIEIEGKTVVIPKNFRITSGNYENTYLLFFNFGTTKLVKLDSQQITNVIGKFDIWLP